MDNEKYQRKNIIMLVGQNRNPDMLAESLDTFNNHDKVYKVYVVAWETCNLYLDRNKNLSKTVIVRNKEFPATPGENNTEFQKSAMDKGLDSIIKNEEDHDIFVMRLRMDVLLRKNQLDYVLSQDYKIKNPPIPEFKYKIWVPWTHLTKPFYLADECFYSHLSVMVNLSPDRDTVLYKLGQGNAHIAWFLKLAKKYNVFENTSEYDDYFSMTNEFTPNKHKIDMIIRYYQCVKDYFIIKTVQHGIKFKDYNIPGYYVKNSNKLLDIIKKKADLNLKIVYCNEELENIVI